MRSLKFVGSRCSRRAGGRWKLYRPHLISIGYCLRTKVQWTMPTSLLSACLLSVRGSSWTTKQDQQTRSCDSERCPCTQKAIMRTCERDTIRKEKKHAKDHHKTTFWLANGSKMSGKIEPIVTAVASKVRRNAARLSAHKLRASPVWRSIPTENATHMYPGSLSVLSHTDAVAVGLKGLKVTRWSGQCSSLPCAQVE